MGTTVKTNLTIGATKRMFFGDNKEHSIEMHNNPSFEKSYDSVTEFLKEFTPTKISDNLMNRIKEEFANGGHITFKPIGYKANQTFYFQNNG